MNSLSADLYYKKYFLKNYSGRRKVIPDTNLDLKCGRENTENGSILVNTKKLVFFKFHILLKMNVKAKVIMIYCRLYNIYGIKIYKNNNTKYRREK